VSIPDPYKVLQVDPEADHDVIEAAYKRLARKYHPDVSTEPDAVVRMVQLNQAWEALRDPVRRGAVDRARQRAAGTSARVVAADGRSHSEARGREEPPVSARPGAAAPAGSSPGSGPSGSRGWPFPGMQDPSTGSFSSRSDHVASSWTSGRSTEGSRYDTRTMGSGAAGPPPGNPSGSLVTFGRYQGWTLGEVARTDLEYLEWLDRMPIGRTYQAEIDALLRQHGRRVTAAADERHTRGLFRRR
jgi:curved DNA-binding protein CbpA